MRKWQRMLLETMKNYLSHHMIDCSIQYSPSSCMIERGEGDLEKPAYLFNFWLAKPRND